jgi:hypothetical protein
LFFYITPRWGGSKIGHTTQNYTAIHISQNKT